MNTKFTEYKGLDLPTVASEVLDFWKKNNIFEQSVSSREGATPYVFFEGPPSANGLPGIHHVMARAIKDIFCRYKTQKGFQVKGHTRFACRVRYRKRIRHYQRRYW